MEILLLEEGLELSSRESAKLMDVSICKDRQIFAQNIFKDLECTVILILQNNLKSTAQEKIGTLARTGMCCAGQEKITQMQQVMATFTSIAMSWLTLSKGHCSLMRMFTTSTVTDQITVELWSKNQPAGQRVEDKVLAAARLIIMSYDDARTVTRNLAEFDQTMASLANILKG